MVKAPAMVIAALAEDGDRQFVMKRIGEESLHLPGFAEIPAWATSETNKRRSAHETLLREFEVLCQFLIGFVFDEHAGDLIVSAAHLPFCLRDFGFRCR